MDYDLRWRPLLAASAIAMAEGGEQKKGEDKGEWVLCRVRKR